MSEAYEPSGAPSQPRAKRGCLATSLIILGIVAAVSLVLCCGGGAFLFFKFKDSIKSAPADVVAVQEKMIGMDIPDEMSPGFAMDVDFFGFMKFQIAAFGDQVQVAQDQGAEAEFRGKFLLLMQMQVAGEDPDDMQAQMEQQPGAQGANIDIDSRETKTIEIDGQQRDFEFAQGTNRDDNSQVRVVRGVFPGRDGTVMLTLVVPEEEWNEEEAMTLLESIHK